MTLEEKLAITIDALKHVMWHKDCGCDFADETGVVRNYPDVERDAMYQNAKEALEQIGEIK